MDGMEDLNAVEMETFEQDEDENNDVYEFENHTIEISKKKFEQMISLLEILVKRQSQLHKRLSIIESGLQLTQKN